jgi:trimethylamine:corrinoid methyltransferase-like protein
VFFKPQIFDRDPYEICLSNGAKKWQQKARDKSLSILKEQRVPRLNVNVIKGFDPIIKQADEELA